LVCTPTEECGVKPSNYIFAQAVCEDGKRVEKLDQIILDV